MHRRARLAMAGAAIAAMAMMGTACGSNEAASPPPTSAATSTSARPAPTSAASSSSAAPAATAAVDAKFTTSTVGGNRFIVGHAIKVQMPSAWVIYSPEKVSTDKTTYEWAAGLPEGTQPLPAGVQFSMGISGKGVQIDTLPTGARALAEQAPGYKFLDAGNAALPGAQTAKFLRFERDIELSTGSRHVEQLSLFVQVEPGVTSTIRFIAAAGDWDKQMKQTYDSVQVIKS